jgi:hypothetical protein
VAAFLLVPVAQAAATGTYTIKLNGTGTGTVTAPNVGFFSGNPTVNCSGPPATGVCEGEQTGFELIPGLEGLYLEATADPGSEFVGWVTEGSGTPEGCGSEAQCALLAEEEADEHIVMTATFNKAGPKFALTVAKTGEGTVVSSPGGITCGGTCSANYEAGKTVTLTASPASGYAFNSWAGCTEHVGLTCKVTLSKATTVKAGFIATPSLTIEKAGSGQGKASATGISCDENCSSATSAIKTGTSVTVKVANAKGSEPAVFEGGTGSASGCSGASCTFTISANSSVVVKFDPKPTHTLTVNLTGPAAYKGKVTGKGTVKGLTASAISCGTGCTTQTESFFASDTVTLTATAGTGYSFAGWSGEESEDGTCTGTTTPCTIPTNAAKTISAEFK